MYDQMSLLDIPSVTFLQELESGHWPYAKPESRTITPSGLAVAHANPLARQELVRAQKMNAISGQHFINSSKPVSHKPLSESRLPGQWCLGQPQAKRCKHCQDLVPLTLYARHTGEKLRAVCNPCRAKAAAEAYRSSDKTLISAKNKSYQEVRRITQRASYLVTAAKQRAKAKGLPFNLDAHRAKLQSVMDQGVCQMTGIPFDMLGKQTWNSPSLDRIVPSKGYTISNVRVVLFSLNVMMHDWGVETVKTVVNALNNKE